LRVDLFLKKAHLVKHRTLAHDLVAGGQVLLNGQQVKPAKECKVGDQLLIRLPNRELLIEIVEFPKQNMSAKAGESCYKILGEKKITRSELF